MTTNKCVEKVDDTPKEEEEGEDTSEEEEEKEGEDGEDGDDGDSNNGKILGTFIALMVIFNL